MTYSVRHWVVCHDSQDRLNKNGVTTEDVHQRGCSDFGAPYESNFLVEAQEPVIYEEC